MIRKQIGLVTTILRDNGNIAVKLEVPNLPVRTWGWTRPEAVAWLKINGHLLKNNSNWAAIIGPYTIDSGDFKSIIRTVRYVLTKSTPKLTEIDVQVLEELRKHAKKALYDIVFDKYDAKNMIDQYFALEDIKESKFEEYLDRSGMLDTVVLLDLFKSGKITAKKVFMEPYAVREVIMNDHFGFSIVKNFETLVVVPHLQSLDLDYIEPGTDVLAVD